MNPLLLLRTLKDLRWEQVAYRPLRIAQYKLYRSFPRFALGEIKAAKVAPPAIETIRQVFANSFVHLNAPAEREPSLTDLQHGRFTFLNHCLSPGTVDWNRRYVSHLWNYQLHYFDFAVWAAGDLADRRDEVAWRACRRLIESWIASARVGQSDGWDAYPLSLRVVNWIYAYALAAESESEEFLARWRASIFQQLKFLRSHLEYHLLANHLLKNVKALVVGGLFFENDQWLSAGERLLWREFDEQVLPDSGHYERSPMYHAQTLADFLECYALLRAFGRIPPKESVEAKLRAMADFLEAMSYPDGTLALFNDSANTAETRPAPLLESARRIVGRTNTGAGAFFPQSGYYLWSSPDKREKIIVDAGAPSVDYNTAHAHCDLLSYELWLDGRPFVVDSGVHGYGGDKFREYCRSTRAHNTVMFDGHEQSEVWGTFRMARRAKPLSAESFGDGQTWDFCGLFVRYDGELIHERRIRRGADGNWTFTDAARNGETSRAASFVHLHPDFEARQISRMSIMCRSGNRRVMIEPFADEGVSFGAKVITGSEAPIQGWHFPNFGVAEPSSTIEFDYQIRSGDRFGYRIRPVTDQ